MVNSTRRTLNVLKQRKNNVKAISSAMTAVLIVVIIVGFIGGAYATGILPLYRTIPNQTTTITPPPSQAYSLNAATTGYDHYNPSTTYTAATNFNVLWDALAGGSYQQLGSNTQTIAIQPSYGGTIYAVVTVPSGQSYYVDPALTQQRNSPLASSWSYTSVANNGVNNFVFKLSGIPGASNPISPLDFYPYFIAQATLSLNSPSALSSVGTTTTTQFIQWQGTFPSGTPNVGDEITEVQVTVNSTNAAVFQLNSVNDPSTWGTNGALSAGLVQGTSFTPQQGSSNYVYTYNIAKTPTDFSTGQFLTYGSNSLDNFPFTVSGTYDFGAATATTNCLSIQLQVYILLASGAISTLTNTVNVASGSVC